MAGFTTFTSGSNWQDKTFLQQIDDAIIERNGGSAITRTVAGTNIQLASYWSTRQQVLGAIVTAANGLGGPYLRNGAQGNPLSTRPNYNGLQPSSIQKFTTAASLWQAVNGHNYPKRIKSDGTVVYDNYCQSGDQISHPHMIQELQIALRFLRYWYTTPTSIGFQQQHNGSGSGYFEAFSTPFWQPYFTGYAADETQCRILHDTDALRGYQTVDGTGGGYVARHVMCRCQDANMNRWHYLSCARKGSLTYQVGQTSGKKWQTDAFVLIKRPSTSNGELGGIMKFSDLNGETGFTMSTDVESEIGRLKRLSADTAWRTGGTSLTVNYAPTYTYWDTNQYRVPAMGGYPNTNASSTTFWWYGWDMVMPFFVTEFQWTYA